MGGHSILIKIYTKPDRSPTSNMWWCKQKIWRGCFHKSTAATKKFADSQLPTKYYLVLPLFHRLFRKLFFFSFILVFLPRPGYALLFMLVA